VEDFNECGHPLEETVKWNRISPKARKI